MRWNERVRTISAGLVALGVAACGGEQKQPETPAREAGGAVGAEMMAGPVFRYDIPDGLQYTQTVRHTRQLTAPGTPMNASLQEEWTFDITVDRRGPMTEFDGTLKSVRLSQNGALVAQTLPQDARISAQIDSEGDVQSVTGAESISEALVAELPEAERQQALGLVSNEAIAANMARRLSRSVRQLNGRPATIGATWIVRPTEPGIRGKTLSVQAEEQCGLKRCMRVDATYQIDNASIADELRGEVIGLVSDEDEGGVSEVTLEDVEVSASDTMLVEVDTLLVHKATFQETIRLRVKGPERTVDLIVTESDDQEIVTR